MSRTDSPRTLPGWERRTAYIETARDIARQDGRRVYVNRDGQGNWYVSSEKRQAVYVVHTDGHVENVR